MSMPMPLLVRRLRNDLSCANSELGVDIPEIPDTIDLPYAIRIDLHDTNAYSAPDTPCPEQSFTVYLGEDYPYERPKVRWDTEIFHPNIMPSSEGGSVCVMELDHWDFDSNLTDFLRVVIRLINEPNPYNALASPTCSIAAKWFLDKV